MATDADLDLDLETQIEDVRAPADIAPGRSIVDNIRQRHARRNRHIDLPIPEWEGDVIVRFGRLPKKALIASSRRKGNPARSNAELLVAACQEVFVRDESGTLQPARAADGLPGSVRFDGRLADLFQLSATEPADVVIAMYGDDIAIGRHAQRVFNWQTGEDIDDLSLEEAEAEAGEA